MILTRAIHGQVEREIKIHSQLFHQNIVALYAAFEDTDHVYLAQEYAAGAHPESRPAPPHHIVGLLLPQLGCVVDEPCSKPLCLPCVTCLPPRRPGPLLGWK